MHKEFDYGAATNIITPFFHRLIEEKKVWKITLDTYEREVERYGKYTIEYAETIFLYDSLAISNFLKIKHSHKERFLFGLTLVTHLLYGFKLNIDTIIELLDYCQNSFGEMISIGKSSNKIIKKKYQEYQKEIILIIKWKEKEYSIFNKEQLSIIESRKNNINGYLKEIKRIIGQKHNSPNEFMKSLIISFMHMTLNRVFKAKQLKYEFLIYKLLLKGL